MQSPAAFHLAPPAEIKEEAAFIARHFRRNAALYMIVITVEALTGLFGNMSMLGPSLVLKSHGPDWLSLFPMPAQWSWG